MKIYVTRGELLAIINAAIADDPSCADCEVSGPLYHLRTPEHDGTNWSDSLIIRGHGRDPRPCAPAAAAAALQARAQYALRNDGGWLDDIVFFRKGHRFMGIADQREGDDQPYWYVTIDSDSERRSFPASVNDTNAEALRDQIFTWFDSGMIAFQPQSASGIDRASVAALHIPMVDRFIYRSFQIDTNRINSRGNLDAMNRLEKWHEDGVIHLDMSEVAHGEARQGGDARRSAKALSYIYSMSYANTAEEQRQLQRIEAVLFPSGAHDQNERNDVEIVFNALKYWRILVTNDGGSKTQPGGILGKRAELAKMGVTVMRDSEAVAYIESEIRRRDTLARQIAGLSGAALPAWVGQD